ncbi:unnamed protein product [Blepharisma stoltei]|uniref:DOMON domain-containing protein n=1 Tax=Blepharisma stoltei TaxID=1481888 RepID=A0AAU9J1U4_9CILI|nr:unnamed protein product [Blepharisma stoltei]
MALKPFVLLIFIAVTVSEWISQVLDDQMTLKWEVSGNKITFNFYCPNAQWCGIGFANTMFGCDMLIAVGGGTAQVPIQVWDMWSENHDTPSIDTDFWSGVTSVFDVTGTFTPNSQSSPSNGRNQNSGTIDATFSRLLYTGDIWDAYIDPTKKMNINWAYKGGGSYGNFDKHNDYSQGKIKLAASSADAYFSSESSDKSEFDTHQGLMTIAWIITAPIGIVIARYLKHFRFWYLFHLLLLSYSVLSTIISVSLVYKTHETSYLSATKKVRYHSRLGFVLTCFVIGQLFIGFICKMLQMFSHQFGMIAQIRRAHKVLGYAMLTVGLMNNSYGYEIFGSASSYYVGLAILLGGWLLLEIRHQFTYKWTWLLLQRKPKEMTHKEAMEKKKMKIMFYDDLVLNVTHFIDSHPGGAYMLKDSIGEDAGKYMVGCSSSGGELAPYEHSKPAFDLAKKLAIGRVPYPEGYLQKKNQDVSQDEMVWNISLQKNLNPSTKFISLLSSQFIMSQVPEHSWWLGKHFKVSAKIKGNTVSRYYSAFFANLHNWADELDGSGNLSKKYPESKTGSLNFIFKVYDKGAVTQYMHNLGESGELHLKGPLGPGLMLNEFSGDYLGFAGGTGLVPFLDVANYMWINRASQLPFTFTLFVSFRTNDDAFCVDLLEGTSQALGENKFKLIKLIDKQAQEIKLSDVVAKYVGMNPAGAWVCGPSGYNKYIKDLLTGAGMERNKVIVM